MLDLIHPSERRSGLAPLRWDSRHRIVVIICWLHVAGVFVFGLVRGYAAYHALIDVVPIAGCTALGMYRFRARRLRSMFTTLATVFASAAIVHLSGGQIEAHFHYFVMIGVIGLYQDLSMYLCAILFVVVDHGLVGFLASSSVYSHHAAVRSPWRWAAIHGAFYMCACLTNIVSWWHTEFAAAHDPLTTLPNRSTFEARHARAYEHNPAEIAVLFVDLDGFKAVNDGLGHHVGDELLTAVGARLRQCVRRRDIVVRLGGDEFAILLERVSALDEVDATGRRLLASFDEPFATSTMPVRVTASIGIAMGATRDGSAADLLRNADIAMRSVKDAGKRQYRIFENGRHEATLLRASLLADLRNAAANGEIGVHYQPIVDLASGGMAGMEALARWNHPTRGSVPPAVFIPLAEEVGLIGEIGATVLARACKEAGSWPVGPDGVRPYLSVNLSPWQLHHPDVIEHIARAVVAAGLAAHELVLEITETALMDSTKETIAMLRRFRECGVRLAIDDFGTGYSSLGYLKSFPVDILKVDKSFIDGVDSGPEESAIARAIIRLADSLGLTVVAEGVERPEQAAILRRLGCVYAQGHLFGVARDAMATAQPSPAGAQAGDLIAVERDEEPFGLGRHDTVLGDAPHR